MIKRLFLLSWLLASLISSDLLSQSKAEIKNIFYDAESWILFEDYKEALPLYQQLLRIYPANSNFKYRIGQCYMNTPGEKQQAISYLEDAVRNIDPNYKEGKFREDGAPYDALYYLANAYRITNQLDKALETYGQFKSNLDPDVYDSTIVNLQIQSCNNARELMSMPLYVKEKNLGANINESNSEFNPVVSDNEDLLFFSKSEAFYDAILYSSKVNGQWSNPLNMNEILKVDKDLFPTSVSKDGKDLYLYSSADYDGIIYTTRFENNSWGPIVKLNENINTKYWESHATISHDNKSLYFTSNRKGTLGGLDIYVSRRDSTGNWGPSVNLGPVINTPYNEESPFLSQDDKTLFFSSRGHFNMGGYDIFYSTLLENGEWSVPLNVGYPLNSTDDDVFFKPLFEGYEGYYAKYSPEGFGKQDIYRIEIFSDDHPRKFFVRGMVKVADLISNIRDSVKISAMNIKNPNQTIIVYSNPETGEYEFELPQGNYNITFEAEGGEIISRNLDLPLLNPADSFVLPGTVLPKTDFTADMTVLSNKTVSVVKGDTIMFPLRVEPRSLLTIEHWVGDSLYSSEQFIVSDSVFNYKMVPGMGDNRLVFKLADRFNNITSTDVFITREKETITQPLVRPEYSRIIAKKQIAAFAEMLKSRGDSDIKKVIGIEDIEKQQFGKVDDLISFLKEEAIKKSISPGEIDLLALRVAVLDNVLTQAAVDIMAEFADGELKEILSGLDIYESGLKTWTDLQEYVSAKSNGRITPDDLNKVAGDILAGIDPSISVIREKILKVSESSDDGGIIRQAIEAVDISNIKLADKWLLAFYNESLKLGLSGNRIAEILSSISTLPETTIDEFMNEMIANSEEPLISSLKSLNLKKEKIRTPRELVLFLTSDKHKDKFPIDQVLKAIGKITSGKDIPVETIGQIETSSGVINRTWPLWVLVGAGLFTLFIILWKRKERRKEKRG